MYGLKVKNESIELGQGVRTWEYLAGDPQVSTGFDCILRELYVSNRSSAYCAFIMRLFAALVPNLCSGFWVLGHNGVRCLARALEYDIGTIVACSDHKSEKLSSVTKNYLGRIDWKAFKIINCKNKTKQKSKNLKYCNIIRNIYYIQINIAWWSNIVWTLLETNKSHLTLRLGHVHPLPSTKSKQIHFIPIDKS